MGPEPEIKGFVWKGLLIISCLHYKEGSVCGVSSPGKIICEMYDSWFKAQDLLWKTLREVIGFPDSWRTVIKQLNKTCLWKLMA